MLMEERQQRILEWLNRKKSATVRELSAGLFVSPATVRRDLAAMEKLGLIKRSHGGAVLFETGSGEISSLVREQENIQKKRQIARMALDFFRPDCSVFLDSSSTAGTVIPMLCSIPCTVITNGLQNALLLSRHTSARIYLAGGTVNSQSGSAVGADTVRRLERFQADLALLSCGGVSLEGGVMDAAVEQTAVKLTMLQHARVRVLLCDSSKFGSRLLCRTCGFEQLDYLLTDQDPGPEYTRAAAEAGCEILWGAP